MKTLLVNGCSWTFGGGLDTPDTKEVITNLHDNIVWPAHVKKLMNFDTQVNLAEGCGSNQRICRTTFDWVMQQDEETLKNTTAIIQWSHEDRYEYYVPTDEEANDFQKRYQVTPATLSDVHPALSIDKQGGEMITSSNYSIVRTLDRWARINPHTVISWAENHKARDVQQEALSRYRTYTPQEGMYSWLFHMGFLYDLLISKGVEVYFWYFTQYVIAMPQEIQDYIYDHFPMLGDNEFRHHNWKYDRIGIQPKGDPHPSIAGHEQLAHIIVDEIAKKKTILRRP